MSEEIKEFFKTYTDFVTQVTSDPSLGDTDELLEEERDKIKERYNPLKATHTEERGEAFHEKKDKNKKTNLIHFCYQSCPICDRLTKPKTFKLIKKFSFLNSNFFRITARRNKNE